MGRKKRYDKELFVMFPKELYNEFQKICEDNYKTMSEVSRELIVKYIKDNREKNAS